MMRRGMGRGRPSLIGTVARTAVIAGTATAVSGKVQGNQAAKAQTAADAQAYRDGQQAPVAAPSTAAPAAPAAAPAASGNLIDELTKLSALQQAGILTPEEFTAAKARLLAG